jgi:LuxR family maltose regulon positive regulatory protein
VFTREGAPMIQLLKRLAGRHRDRAYVRQLLAPMTAPDNATGSTASPPSEGAIGPRTGAPRQPALVDPLSSRELDVLRLLGTDLDGPAIARELGVSLTTVRTHTQHIYTKLGVNNRRAAVRHAHQLNLFSGAARPLTC